ncbi:MAG: tryptophan 7-halogenase [Geodermatophilales bacterium]|nr:tryptophan 7-halogenase [Geodermatophilales bacterium]
MEHWDVVVVGGGPAGAACAAAARRASPYARVLVLDRSDFPRDKVCGDGIAPEALDVLAGLGLDAERLTDGFPAVPRAVLDDRLLTAALACGAEFRRHTVRRLEVHDSHVVVDESVTAGVVVGADGAESVVRRALGIPPNGPRHTAIAIRGYAREPAGLDGVQLITTTEQRWPAYAWSFPLGGGRANVGYGELVSGEVTRGGLLHGLSRLLPGTEPEAPRAHRLPLSTGRPRQPDGRVLLVGDAASLINPLTGEGIFYAVLSGALAGAAAVGGGDPGAAYRRALEARLGRHLRHSATASALSRWPRLMDAVFRAAAADQSVFDDVVHLGLADGRLTARTLAGAARHLR